MSVKTISEVAWNCVKYSSNPSKMVEDLSTVWNQAFEGTTAREPLSLATVFATAKGIAWNTILVPIQGAVSAGANFIIIRHVLRSFVDPEPHSSKDLVIHIISFVGSTAVGYGVAESAGYCGLPHLNPGYDSRCISLAASVVGATGATFYCIYRDHLSEQERQNQENQWFFTKLVNRFI